MKLKYVLLPLAIVASIAGGVQLVRQFAPPDVSEPTVTQSLETTFPKDTPIPVDVQTPPGSSELLARRELRDQIRDWLLLTVLTTSGVDPEKLNDITFDLPPVRYSFMKPVADWEFGAVRSRAVGNGTVIALIPADAGSRRVEYLSDIADQNRKNLGQQPTRVIVMEYEINPGFSAATLTRRETVDGAALFSARFGYIERQVKTLAEFKSFQNAVDDLTYVTVRQGAVILGGRRIPGRPIRGIKTEDVAALWQAEDKLTTASEEYKRFVAQKEKELENRWKYRTYRRGDYLEEGRLRRQLEADQAAIVEELQAYRRKHGVSDSLGFSLDPAYDYERMADYVAAILPRLPVGTAKQSNKDTALSPERRLLRGLDIGERTGSSSGLSSIEVAKVVAGLRSGSTRAFFEALQKLEGKLGEWFYSVCEEGFGLQAARYDGDLQYTEPGMILFYTDLLAKLWALDYVRSAPEDQIEDFVPLTRLKISPVFRKELEDLRHTRLWFGPQNKGFQITPNKEIILSRNATRLYAASATSLKQGEESAPHAQTAAFLGWWDDHYEEVAGFEPEYERLNEIMKWSLVLGWLHQNNDLQTFSYLKDVKVRRDNWFPDWVRRHPELRFRQWEKIKFFPKGAFGLETEALPRLRSAEFEQFGEPGHYMAGGVSLANRATFAERPLLSTRVAEGLRRSNIKYTEAAGNGFRTLEGVEYSLARSVNRYEVVIKPAAEMRLRGRVGELANQPIKRTLEVSTGRFEYRARAGDTQIGSLNIGKNGNGFKVGWTGRDLDSGYSLGRRLSTRQDLGSALAQDTQVSVSTRLPDGTYVARVRGSDRWVRFAEENQVSSKLEGEWQARVAGFERNAKSVKIQWVDDAWVKDRLGTGKFDQLVHQAQGRLKPGEELVDLMYRRDIHQVAERIAQDPLRMYAEMDKAYRIGLSQADELVSGGKVADATEHLARMERVWGPTADISTRRAIALADSKDFAGAARAIERAAVGRARSVEGVYEELARRIARSATRQEAQTWEAMRAATEWKAVGSGGRPRLVPSGDHLSLEFHLADDAVKGQHVPVEEVIRSRASVYVQDSPQLHNLDWSVDIHRTMRQAVDGDLATVVRLPRVDVAHFRPAKIYTADETVALKKVESSSNAGVRGGQNVYRSFSSSECYSNNGTVTAAPNNCPEDRQAVYLIVPKDSEHRYE